jgi:hypothetical protein
LQRPFKKPVWVIEAFQTSLQGCCIEVHQQSCGKTTDLQVGDDLRAVDGMKPVHSLDFDDDAAVDEKIDSEAAADALAFVTSFNGGFSESKPPRSQKLRCYFSDGLKKQPGADL